MRLNDLTVKNLRNKATRYDKREGGGFAIRVWPSGAKTWLYVFTFEGKRYQMKLFKHGVGFPEITTDMARKKYNEARDILITGKNPAAVEREMIEARLKAPTVTDLCNEYIERHAKRFKRSWEKDERILNHDVIPAWGKRKAADIEKRDVIRHAGKDRC